MSKVNAVGPPLIALAIVLAVAWHVLGFHIVHKPTEDQLYGCTVEQQAPNGECQ